MITYSGIFKIGIAVSKYSKWRGQHVEPFLYNKLTLNRITKKLRTKPNRLNIVEKKNSQTIRNYQTMFELNTGREIWIEVQKIFKKEMSTKKC